MKSQRRCPGLLVITILVSLSAARPARAASGGAAPSGNGGAAAPAQQPAAPVPQAGPAPAPEVTEPAPTYGPLADFFEAKKQLEKETGTIPRLNIDLTSQSAVSGPDDFTSWVWRYDFGITQKLWQGAQADIDVRGGQGPDAGAFIGSTMNTNQYGATGSLAFVLHFWVEQKFFDDQFTLRGGKMDLGDFMDVNRFGYYNFLGFSQNHNPAIEFPGNPLAGMFTIEPKNVPMYLSAGIANAAQSSYQSGFPDLVRGREAPFAMTELGLKVNPAKQPGIYRFIGWYDGLNLTTLDGGRVDNGRYGLALDFDQNITADLGLFARYGFADQNEFVPRQYWQVGFDWKGIIPGRGKDDLALAVAQNLFSSQRQRITPNAANSETYIEAYYNAVIYDWLQLQPFLQVLENPGGRKEDAAWILSVHLIFRL